MLVLVCGSRAWNDATRVKLDLAALRKERGSFKVIHGGAIGADRIAGYAAAQMGLPVEVFYANWKEEGKMAGFNRNLRMLDENPDLVLAYAKGKSTGTRHTIAQARERGIDVRVVEG